MGEVSNDRKHEGRGLQESLKSPPVYKGARHFQQSSFFFSSSSSLSSVTHTNAGPRAGDLLEIYPRNLRPLGFLADDMHAQHFISLSVVRLNFYYVRSYQMVVGRNIGVLFRVSASHFFSLFLLGLILILVRRELNRNRRLILFVEFWI